MKKIKLITPILTIATLSSVVVPLVGCSCNTSKEKITPKLVESSEGVKIKEFNIVKGKDSTITLTIPEGKKIKTKELVVKVGETILATPDAYTLNGNVITIKASAMASDSVTLKVIVEDIGTDVTYDETENKYKSSSIDVKPNSTITFNIKIGEKTTNKVVCPQTFSIVKDGSTDLVPITKVESITINDVAFTEYELKDNKIDLSKLNDKVLAKDDIVKVVLTTTNETQIKAKAVCEPYIEAQYIDVYANKAFQLSVNEKHWDGTLEYSKDGGTEWKTWDGSAGIDSVETSGKHRIYLRGKNNKHFAEDDSKYTNFTFTDKSGTEEPLKVSFNGDITMLLNYEKPDEATMDEYCFCKLFLNCDTLASVPKLPLKNLTKNCYQSMFTACTGLTSLPENLLPATTLVESCYSLMFKHCTGLTELPEKLLPSTTLANSCYESMFEQCTGLTSLPENLLPAKKLVKNCYVTMFGECTGLTELPAGLLQATEIVEGCYAYMFMMCEGLTKIGLLAQGKPLVINGKYACNYMFAACTNLKVAECAETDTNKFMTIASIEGEEAVSDMFNYCKEGSIITPEAGKSYKYVIEQ